MIDSTSSSGRTPALAPEALIRARQQAAVTEESDSLSAANVDFLKSQVAGQADLRPSEVERGQGLAADPAYPPTVVVRNVAQQIINSPDPSEEEDEA